MKYLHILLAGLIFFGCSDDPSNDKTPTQIPNTNKEVEVFTTAPVVNAVVTDSAKQLAKYNPKTFKYEFTNNITFPITVKTNSDTFVDIDYDNKMTAVDIKPSVFADSLKSFCNEVNLLTNLYYSKNYEDANISIEQYKQDIKNRFDIDICSYTIDSEKNSKVLFGAYNYVLNGNTLSYIEDIDSDVAKINDFFSKELTTITSNKTHYYSSYNSLIWLDKHKVIRADTLNRPDISGVLRYNVKIYNSIDNLDVFDIYINDNFVFSASGHDEFAYLKEDLSSPLFLGTGDIDSFGLNLYDFTYNSKECIFLSNKKDGILPIEVTSTTAQKLPKINQYIDENNATQNITNDGVVYTNGFISISQNKRFLGISTLDKGFYLINIKDIFTNCQQTSDINSSHLLIQDKTGTSISSEFRENGDYLYVANKQNGISGYDITTPTQADINSSKTTITLYNNEEAYNIKLFPNSNELIVTTNKGLQVYDVSSALNIKYISSYETEGSEDNYFPDIEFANDFLVITDGTKGVKILRLDSSYTPELCGVEYFSNPTKPSELAKVTSVKYYDNYLYVGLDTFGIKKVKFSDLLFKHCK